MARNFPIEASLEDQLYQALETEQGGIKVYETAITCAVNDGLRTEWTQHLFQTRHHEQVLLEVFEAFGLDPDARPPSRDLVSGIGDALVVSMRKAQATVSPEQAEIIAWEAVVLADCRPQQFADLAPKSGMPVQSTTTSSNASEMR
jgi:hypothetical protein